MAAGDETVPVRLDPGSYLSAIEALEAANPQLHALIESAESPYARLRLAAKMAMLIATIVWKREAEPHQCPRCGLNLHEPPTREELKGLDRGAE